MPDTSLTGLSAVEARRRIMRGEVSPVELLDACIARIERLDPAVNAITVIDHEHAREAARQAERSVVAGAELPLLHGLPVGIKDTQDVAGLLSTSGSPVHRHRVPERDDEHVARVRASGALIFCKTNTPERAAGANTRNPVWGATGNPFDPTRTCGGSSGGSAVAVATDMMPLATGSDTGGSLRIPAAYCGVVGFRPSPGTVPNSRRALGWTPISVLGPLARTVDDACLLLAAQATFDSRDPFSVPLDPVDFISLENIDLADLRVAVSVDLGFAEIDETYRSTFDRKARIVGGLFKEFEQVIPDLRRADGVFDVIRAASFMASLHEEYVRDPTALGANPRANYELGLETSLLDHALAHAEQTRMYREFQELFQRFDVLIVPTVPISPFPWEWPYLTRLNDRELDTYYRWLAPCYGISLTGHPAITIPCGVDDEGMPFGLQVVGQHRGDRRLLAIARALEEAFISDPELARPLPDLERLREPVPALTSIVTHPPDSSP